jgi:cell division protein FtsB
MGARMCERTKAAVDMLQQQKRTLTKGEIITVFKKVIDDLDQQGKQMGDRMTRLEEKVTSLENKVDAGFAEIKAMLEEQCRKRTLFEEILMLRGHKWFWISLIVTLLILAGLLGIPLTGFNGILTINGG